MLIGTKNDQFVHCNVIIIPSQPDRPACT